MNRRVQIVDELRADVLARSARRRPERDERVGLDGREECGARFGSFGIEPAGRARRSRARALERRRHLVEVFANIAARGRPFVALAALRGIREHELVAGLDGLDALFEIVVVVMVYPPAFLSLCSVDSRCVIQPRIMARVYLAYQAAARN